MLRRFAGLLILVALPGAAVGQVPDVYGPAIKAIDAFVEHQVKDKKFPSLSIALVDDHRVSILTSQLHHRLFVPSSRSPPRSSVRRSHLDVSSLRHDDAATTPARLIRRRQPVALLKWGASRRATDPDRS